MTVMKKRLGMRTWKTYGCNLPARFYVCDILNKILKLQNTRSEIWEKGHIFKGRHRTIYTVTNMITDVSSNVLQLLHHLADPLGDLLALIVHLPVNLLLHQHLNDDRHPSNNLYYHCPMALSWYHHQKRAKWPKVLNTHIQGNLTIKYKLLWFFWDKALQTAKAQLTPGCAESCWNKGSIVAQIVLPLFHNLCSHKCFQENSCNICSVLLPTQFADVQCFLGNSIYRAASQCLLSPTFRFWEWGIVVRCPRSEPA